MTGELFINGKDAWTEWGVNMGSGFLDAVDAPLPMKAYIEDESRLEHGKRMDTASAKADSREITVGFTITGSSESDYRTKRKAFFETLEAGLFTLSVPALGADVYKFVYTGKSVTYGMSRSRSFGHFTMKVTEPNPKDRE